MNDKYYPLSVIVKMYPSIAKDKITEGTEIGEVRAEGGIEPYTYEVLDLSGNPLSSYSVVGNKIIAVSDISLSEVVPFQVKVTESEMSQPVKVRALSMDEEEEQETSETRERVSEVMSLSVTPLVETSPSIQSMFSKENMIYKITREIDLGGGTLVIPKNTTLDFQGGAFKNGVLSGWVNIKDCNYQIFNNITFAPGAYIPYIKPEYYGAVGDGTTDASPGINTMLQNVIASCGEYTYDGFVYKDVTKTKFIFQGKYSISSGIKITAPVYKLCLEGLNLEVSDTLDPVQDQSMLSFSGGASMVKILDCDFNCRFKINNGIIVNGSYCNANIIERLRLYGFLTLGVTLSPSENSIGNKILDSDIYQVETYTVTPPVTLTTGIGVSTNSDTHNTVIKAVNFGCIKNIPLYLNGEYDTILNCEFSSIDETSLSTVAISRNSLISECNFTDVVLKIGGSTKVTECSFYIYNGTGVGIIQLTDTFARFIRGTLIRNNSIYYGGDNVSEGGFPIMWTQNRPISGDVSVIDNIYQGNNIKAQLPNLSSYMKDAIIKLVPEGTAIWSSFSTDGSSLSAIQIGDILIHWGVVGEQSGSGTSKVVNFQRSYADTNYSRFVVPHTPTGEFQNCGITSAAVGSCTVGYANQCDVLIIGKAAPITS